MSVYAPVRLAGAPKLPVACELSKPSEPRGLELSLTTEDQVHADPDGRDRGLLDIHINPQDVGCWAGRKQDTRHHQKGQQGILVATRAARRLGQVVAFSLLRVLQCCNEVCEGLPPTNRHVNIVGEAVRLPTQLDRQSSHNGVRDIGQRHAKLRAQYGE